MMRPETKSTSCSLLFSKSITAVDPLITHSVIYLLKICLNRVQQWEESNNVFQFNNQVLIFNLFLFCFCFFFLKEKFCTWAGLNRLNLVDLIKVTVVSQSPLFSRCLKLQ